MIIGNINRKMKRGVVLLTLVLVAAISISAMAETTNQNPAMTAGNSASVTAPVNMLGRGRHGHMLGGYIADLSSLTEAQKAAHDSALALYEEIEDAVLSDLCASCSKDVAG